MTNVRYLVSPATIMQYHTFKGDKKGTKTLKITGVKVDRPPASVTLIFHDDCEFDFKNNSTEYINVCA